MEYCALNALEKKCLYVFTHMRDLDNQLGLNEDYFIQENSSGLAINRETGKQILINTGTEELFMVPTVAQ